MSKIFWRGFKITPPSSGFEPTASANAEKMLITVNTKNASQPVHTDTVTYK
jgi:hypothetical protein